MKQEKTEFTFFACCNNFIFFEISILYGNNGENKIYCEQKRGYRREHNKTTAETKQQKI